MALGGGRCGRAHRGILLFRRTGHERRPDPSSDAGATVRAPPPELFRHPTSTPPRPMLRWYRFLVLLLVAMLSAMPVRTAWAAPSTGSPEIGELAPGNGNPAGPALVVPHDVPIVLPTAREAIP